MPVTNELIEPVVGGAVWRVKGRHEGPVGVHDALGAGAGGREGQVDDVVFEGHLGPLRGTLPVVFEQLAVKKLGPIEIRALNYKTLRMPFLRKI